MVVGCGSQTQGTPTEATEPPPTVVARIPLDAAVDAAAIAPPPMLACEPGTTLRPAPAPEPTWACVRPDGTRHGPFVTQFPDATPEVEGSYQDGALDGRWTRRSPYGALVEEGSYRAGAKDGMWTQRNAVGAVLGSYQMAMGTGTERAWLENGALYSERALLRGVLHGNARTFAADGTLIQIASYDHGKLDGPHQFGTRGSMRFEEVFADGVRRGRRLIWVQGVLVADENYDRGGRLDGLYTSWRRAKVMRVQGTYKKGKREGLWTWFDRGNNKEREGTYVSGDKQGTWQEWWERRLVFSGQYVDGKPDGEFAYYDRGSREIGRFSLKAGTGTLLTFHTNKRPSSRQYLYQGALAGIYQELTPLGKVVVEGRYRNDLRHGTWKEWTAAGAPTLEQTWKRGKLDGIVKKYIAGKLATEAHYVEGKATGSYLELRDGRPAITGQFVDDERHGTWTTFAADGSVMAIATYQRNVLDGPWQQLVDGAVVEGQMVGGRRSGAWKRTERSGTSSTIDYPDLTQR
jgi:uncharacterized protein